MSSYEKAPAGGTAFLLVIFAALVGAFAYIGARAQDSRTPQAHVDGVAQPAERRVPNAEGAGSTPAAVATDSPSGREAPAPVASGSGAGSGPEGVSPSSVDLGSLAGVRWWDDTSPTEDILATTVDLWSFKPFQDFVGNRVASYPTEEDARYALESKDVRDALWAFLVADSVAASLELGIPGLAAKDGNVQRRTAPKEIVDDAKRARDTAQMDLYRALDHGSAYHEWETLGMLWVEFDQ